MTVSDFTPQTAPTVVTAPPPEVLREMAAYSARAQVAKGVPADYTLLLPVDTPPVPASAAKPRRTGASRSAGAPPRPAKRARSKRVRSTDRSTRGALRAAQGVLWLQAGCCFLAGVALPSTGLLPPSLSFILLIPILGMSMVYGAVAWGVRKRSHVALVVACTLHATGLLAAVPLALHGAWALPALASVFLFTILRAERCLVRSRARSAGRSAHRPSNVTTT